MHVIMYVLSALTLIGGLIGANKVGDIYVLDQEWARFLVASYIAGGILGSALLATFGRIEQHLGRIASAYLNRRLVDQSERTLEPYETRISPENGAARGAVVESGRLYGKYPFQLLSDGRVLLNMEGGYKEFFSLPAAKAAIDALKERT